MHEFFFSSNVLTKPGILILDLYLYGMKIQTNIKHNSIKKYARKSHIFWKIFFLKFFLTGQTRPTYFTVGQHCSAQYIETNSGELSTVHVNSGAARARKKKKKRSGGLPGGCPFLRELELSVLCCWTMVLSLLCYVFSVFLLLPSFVSCFSFSSFVSNGGGVVVDGGCRRWWTVFAAILLVCAEAQASSFSSRVLQQGEEDGERLMVALLQTAERERLERLRLLLFSSPLCSCFSVPFHLPQIKLFPPLLCFLFFIPSSLSLAFPFFFLSVFLFFSPFSRLAFFFFSPFSSSVLPFFFSFPLYVIFFFLSCLSVHPLAFIARGCRRFHLLLQGQSNGRRASWWREMSAVRHAPLIKANQCLRCCNVSRPAAHNVFWRRQWTVFSETTPFFNFKWYFWFGPWMFLQFCNQASGKIIIGSLDFRPFFGLVIGFGLFQLSP